MSNKNNITQLGRLDGSRLTPPWDARDQATNRQRILDEGHQIIGQYMKEFTLGDEKLMLQYFDNLEVRNIAQRQLDTAKENKEKVFDNYEVEHGSVPTIIKPVNYLVDNLIIGLIYSGEIILGYATFSFLGLPGIGQLILAICVGIMFGLTGHRLGQLLRQGNRRNKTDLIFILICIVLPSITMFMTAYLREIFTSSQLALQNTEASKYGIPIMETNHISIIFSFFVINLMLYGLAVIQSYNHYNELVMAMTDLQKANLALGLAERRLNSSMTSRKKHAYSYLGKAIALRAEIEARSRDYEGANLSARNVPEEISMSIDSGRGKPLSFLTPLELKFPDCWKDPDNHLKWDKP